MTLKKNFSFFSQYSIFNSMFKHPYFVKHRTRWAALVGIILISLIAQSLYQFFATVPPVSPPALEVQTVQVKSAAMPEFIESVGTLTAKTELKIKAGTTGKIQKLLVESGSFAKTGTLLAEVIGAPDLRAPFDGYLGDWQVKVGEYITPGMELVDLVNTDLLSITYKVPENYAPKLDVGQSVELSVKAFPDQKFKGSVQFVSPVVDRKTYTILLRATVQNPKQALWPGMSAHVQHLLATEPEALVIPESALILSMEGYEVFVLQDGKLLKRAIKIGDRQKGRVHVLSGLNLGESIVMVRTPMMAEGAAAVGHEWLGDW